MKTTLTAIGVLMMVVGCIWFLQTTSLLPRRFMAGQPQWAVYGGAAILIGVALLISGRRRRLRREARDRAKRRLPLFLW